MTIGRRLTLWYAAVLLLGLALFGAGMWFALQHRLMEGIDARLSQRVEGLRTVLEVEHWLTDRNQLRVELSEFAQEVPEGSLIHFQDSRGPLLPVGEPRPPLASMSDSPIYRNVLRNGQWYRVLTTRLDYGGTAYHVLVASSLDEMRAMMQGLRVLLFLLVPGVLLIASLGGYWISRRALAPVDEITRVAKSISVHYLSERLKVPDTGDEIQRLSETWNEMLERLEASVERTRQFTADASHELRTPVALIRTTAELALRRERRPAEYQDSLRSVQIEAERMTELIESLLELARTDRGAPVPMEPVDLNAVVDEVVRENQSIAAARGVRLTGRPAGKPAIAPANAPAIRRVLLDLVDNAMQHTPTGGEITVSASREATGVRLAVEDNGEGIPVEALPHIFERFFRADNARSSGSGLGLGLSIAQAIAHAHGTRITVASTPGAGARFDFLLVNPNLTGSSESKAPHEASLI
jgi:two-component system heavy metal sensor histidine kinase CusS